MTVKLSRLTADIRNAGCGNPGWQGTAVATGDPYQVAILDMHMPGTDEERLIAAAPTLCAAQVIKLTSLGDRGAATRLIRAGFPECVTKPVRRSALFDCFATMLLIPKPDGREASRLLVVSGKMSEAERLQFRILVTEGAALLPALEHQFALLKGELAEVSPCES
jgi:CheY-like chemotaxis protein